MNSVILEDSYCSEAALLHAVQLCPCVLYLLSCTFPCIAGVKKYHDPIRLLLIWKRCLLLASFATLAYLPSMSGEKVKDVKLAAVGHWEGCKKTQREHLFCFNWLSVVTALPAALKWNFVPWHLFVESSLHFGLEGVGKVQWWFHEEMSRNKISLRSAAEL